MLEIVGTMVKSTWKKQKDWRECCLFLQSNSTTSVAALMNHMLQCRSCCWGQVKPLAGKYLEIGFTCVPFGTLRWPVGAEQETTSALCKTPHLSGIETTNSTSFHS